VEEKVRIVMAVLAGEVSIADAARRESVSEQSIGRWKAEFLEAVIEIRVWKKSAEGRLGPSRTSR